MQQLNTFKEDRVDRYESEFDLVGDEGTHFRIIVRRDIIEQNDFSVILRADLPEKPKFILLHYDGSNHNHRNRVERNRIVRQPHIHRATQRYQEDPRKLLHDGYAEPTDRYQDLAGAWNCFRSDLDLQYPEEHQLGIFPVRLPWFMGE